MWFPGMNTNQEWKPAKNRAQTLSLFTLRSK